MLYCDQLPFRVCIAHSGCTEHFLAVWDVAHDTGLRFNDNSVADFQMPGQADLPGQGCVITDLRAAGYANLRNHNAVLADAYVMCDLDQVVYFCAASDPGGA
jgi:predicted transcriptional regulator